MSATRKTNRIARAVLPALVVTALATASARANLLAYYVDGTDADAAALVNLASSPLVTASGLSQVGFLNGAADITRTEFGAGNNTPAGPTAGSASASEWLFARMQHTPAATGSGDDYWGFTVTAAADNLHLTQLTFDHVLANSTAVTGLTGAYTVFASVNAGAFTSIGSGTANGITAGGASMGTVKTQITGLGALPVLGIGDTVEFRIAIADNSDLASRAQYVQGIQLDGFSGAAQYQIDIDSTRLSSSDTSGPLSTAAAWTSLNATNPLSSNGASVTLDGIKFEVASADSSRVRVTGSSPSPNPLTGDFVFDDGSGEAVILLFGGAGALKAGLWMVELWSWDQTSPFGNQIVGYRTNTAETIITTSAVAHATDPMVAFTFFSDGVSAYDVFLRENNASDRTRLNAVRLTLLVPAPAALPAGLGLLALAAIRRRRR